MTATEPKRPGRELARVAGALLLFYIFGVVLSVVLISLWARFVGWPAASEPLGVPEFLAQGFIQIIGFGLLSLLLIRVLRPSPATDWRLGSTGAGRGFLVGLGIAALMAASAMLLGTLLGSAHWVGDTGSPMEYARSVALSFVALAPAALAEEIAFRGVPLVLLASVAGRGTAIVVLALLFALVHLQNPDVSALAIGNIALAGVVLGLAFYGPGGLWTAWGAHLGWNGALAALDAPVSGLPLRMPLLDFVPGNPAWLTGGSFGPEGGLVATIVFGTAAFFLGRRAGKATTA